MPAAYRYRRRTTAPYRPSIRAHASVALIRTNSSGFAGANPMPDMAKSMRRVSATRMPDPVALSTSVSSRAVEAPPAGPGRIFAPVVPSSVRATSSNGTRITSPCFTSE